MAPLNLEEIARMAKEHTASPAERRAQRLSLIMGLMPHNTTLTREKVSGLVDQLEGREEVGPPTPQA